MVGPKIKSGDGKATKLMLGYALLSKAICAEPESTQRLRPRVFASAKVDTNKNVKIKIECERGVEKEIHRRGYDVWKRNHITSYHIMSDTWYIRYMVFKSDQIYNMTEMWSVRDMIYQLYHTSNPLPGCVNTIGFEINTAAKFAT